MITCKYCNKLFKEYKNKIYCNVYCFRSSRIKKIDVNCKKCGKSFKKKPSSLKNSKSGFYFCSKKCKNDSQKIGGIKEIMPSHYGTSKGRDLYRNLIKNNINSFCVILFNINLYFYI